MTFFRRYLTVRNEEFLIPDINLRLWVNAAIYFVASMMWGLNFWRSLGVASIVLLATKFHFGQRLFMQVGVLLVFFIVVVLADVIPPSVRTAFQADSIVEMLQAKRSGG
jgi:hypothetical protein